MRVTKENRTKARAARRELEALIKRHGSDVVRWVWNKISSGLKLRARLLAEKKRIDSEIAKLNRKMR